MEKEVREVLEELVEYDNRLVTDIALTKTIEKAKAILDKEENNKIFNIFNFDLHHDSAVKNAIRNKNLFSFIAEYKFESCKEKQEIILRYLNSNKMDILFERLNNMLDIIDKTKQYNIETEYRNLDFVLEQIEEKENEDNE